MAGNFYVGTDASVRTGSANFSTLISASPLLYNLTAAQATAYAALDTAYGSAFDAAKDPGTRTSVTVAAKDQARKSLVASAKELAAIVLQSSATNAQLQELGLSRRSIPTPIAAPGVAPRLDVLSVEDWTVRIRLHDATSSVKRGKPPGVFGASVFSYVGVTPPADIAGWKLEGSTGKVTKIDIVFDSALAAGTRVWLTAFWFNGRKQSGPACAPVAAYVQYGSISLAA